MREYKFLLLQAGRAGEGSAARAMGLTKSLVQLSWRGEIVQPWYWQSNRRPGRLARVAGMVSTQFKWASELLIGRRPQVALVWWHFAALPSVLLAGRLGIPVVLDVNGPLEEVYFAYPALRLIRPIVKWLALNQLRMADRINGRSNNLCERPTAPVGGDDCPES